MRTAKCSRSEGAATEKDFAPYTFKVIYALAPSYLSELLEPYVPMRMLRSSSQLLLLEPKFNLKTYGSRAFSVCASRLWNSLLKKSGNVILLTLLKGNLRHTFSRVHISVSFTMFLLLLLFFGTFEALLDIVIKSSPI